MTYARFELHVRGVGWGAFSEWSDVGEAVRSYVNAGHQELILKDREMKVSFYMHEGRWTEPPESDRSVKA